MNLVLKMALCSIISYVVGVVIAIILSSLLGLSSFVIEAQNGGPGGSLGEGIEERGVLRFLIYAVVLSVVMFLSYSAGFIYFSAQVLPLVILVYLITFVITYVALHRLKNEQTKATLSAILAAWCGVALLGDYGNLYATERNTSSPTLSSVYALQEWGFIPSNWLFAFSAIAASIFAIRMFWNDSDFSMKIDPPTNFDRRYPWGKPK